MKGLGKDNLLRVQLQSCRNALEFNKIILNICELYDSQYHERLVDDTELIELRELASDKESRKSMINNIITYSCCFFKKVKQ